MEKKVALLRVGFDDEREFKKIMKAASSVFGVESIAMDAGKKILTVIGEFDPPYVSKQIEKVCRSVEVVSLGPAKEEKKDDQGKKKIKKKEDDEAKKKVGEIICMLPAGPNMNPNSELLRHPIPTNSPYPYPYPYPYGYYDYNYHHRRQEDRSCLKFSKPSMEQKVVFRVSYGNAKQKNKVMEAAGVPGVDSIAMDEDKKLLTVIGNFDLDHPVDYLIIKVREACPVEVVSIGPAKEEEGR
ncbi:hypothetical protein CCACVL1_14598 [Corchorus capsularis]|uniref:HMA domain-containing protein n=1 Tax=Corchorus capsularis TaxID=210143 RepID=A0A1R3I6M7_COCAP|nr:hypothetical protein CCACVL1_14598 [Corchorus capsularis]